MSALPDAQSARLRDDVVTTETVENAPV